ncbi:MAG: Ig-like domain-containing protein [Microbacterium sp.]|uniref:beta strand repeat-containing protein n=1 Tax=Microbacterium sp. TaxID=51671 RepID=UPI0039E54784
MLQVRSHSPAARDRAADRRRRIAPGAAIAITAFVGATMGLGPVAAFAADTITCTDGGALSGGTLTVASGETCTVTATTSLQKLVITDATSAIAVPDGYSLSIVVDGVETGQYYDGAASAVAPSLVPGTYESASDTGVQLVVTATLSYTQFGTTFPLRQALEVDASGVVEDGSVTQAITGGSYDDDSADGVTITSTGDGLAGIDVEGGEYAINDPTIAFDGNGRLDFAGIGAGIRVANSGTSVRVDGADIDNTGAVRSGIVVTDGATAVVKDSTIATADGVLPDDYTLSPPPNMRAVPWALGLTGNVRATNLVGNGTKATYLNDDVSSTNWGVLSTDSTSNSFLTSIGTTITTLDGGYGSYADGQSVTDTFLGTTFDVDDYGVISTGGTINIGDASQAAVTALNDAHDLGLTDEDIADVVDAATTIDSGRFGIMWHGGGSSNIAAGTVSIDGATAIHTGETTFQDKANGVTLNVDGSDGATIQSDTGVIFQLMESDDPGGLSTTSVYTDPVYADPTATATRDTSWDLSSTSADKPAIVNLTDLDVAGDFYNAVYTDTPKNLILNLDGSSVAGLITSSTSVHDVATISYDDGEGYKNIGEVTNTATTPVNNGVIVSLADSSTWTVTGTSYVTSLTTDDTSSIEGADGRAVTISGGTVGSTPISPSDLVAGETYTGTYGDPIVVTVADLVPTTTTVAVSSSSVTEGTAADATVTVAADDATPAGDVTVSVDGTEVGTATLDADGTATLTLPSDLAVGSHTVTATYATGSGFEGSTGEATLEVTAAVPTLTVSPGSVAAGGTVTVSGSGLEPNESYEIWLHSDPVQLATGTADSDGTFSLTVTIPSSTTTGSHQIELRPATSTAVYADLTVTAAASSSSSLASTGSDFPAAPVAFLSALLLLLGGSAVVAARRRLRRTHD